MPVTGTRLAAWSSQEPWPSFRRCSRSLAAWLPGWAAALIIAGAALAVAAAAAVSGWSRRVRAPLARTRESVKEDLEWVKQRIA
jgi:hypothetical protein